MGWVEAKDPKTGKTYYYNKATKETSWKKPAELQAKGGTDDPDDPNNDPKFWRESKDPKTGKVYFYNKKTKKTSWHRPACLGAAEPKEKASGGGGSSSSADPKDVWKEAVDPKSGRPYWYNKSTKKTTWKDPTKKAEEPVKKTSSAQDGAKGGAKKIDDLFDDDSDDDDDDEIENEDDNDKQQKDTNSAEIMKRKQAQYENDLIDVTHGDDEDDEPHEFKFAKHRHGWLSRITRTGAIMDDQKLLTFKKSLIKKALLKENRTIDAEAVQCFKNIMSYMGDRKSGKEPIQHVKKMLRNLMQSPAGLRDEAYMQLCKQTTENPRIESTIKGWELMVFCLATFPPSKRLKDFLLDFIGRTIESNTDPQVTNLAECCKEWLPQIVKMGQRKYVPSRVEIESLKAVKDVPIKVNLVDSTFKSFMVNPYVLVKNVEGLLIEKYNLSATDPFALYEQAEENIERILDGKDRILDVLASWESKKEEVQKDRDGPTKKERGQYHKHKDQNKRVVHV